MDAENDTVNDPLDNDDAEGGKKKYPDYYGDRVVGEPGVGADALDKRAARLRQVAGMEGLKSYRFAQLRRDLEGSARLNDQVADVARAISEGSKETGEPGTRYRTQHEFWRMVAHSAAELESVTAERDKYAADLERATKNRGPSKEPERRHDAQGNGHTNGHDIRQGELWPQETQQPRPRGDRDVNVLEQHLPGNRYDAPAQLARRMSERARSWNTYARGKEIDGSSRDRMRDA